jgi:hypothetical protein
MLRETSMKRPRKDPTAWRATPEAHARYLAARDEAQAKANELGFDYGLEANDVFKTFHVFMLPSAQHRCGHELRCEVVHPMTDNVKPGHGWEPTRQEIRKVFNG